jgi:hypothetical protein
MFVLVDNAYGGGGASNQPGVALTNGTPRDMKVKYQN